MPKTAKRILSVTIKRMYDESPDTSYLGKYTSRVTSEYVIDRRHTQDCAAQNDKDCSEAERILSNAVSYIESTRTICKAHTHTGLSLCETCEQEKADQTAIDDLISAQESLSDCDCGGVYRDLNSCEYFEPNYQNYKGCTEEEIRKYCWQDYERMEGLNNQNWYYLGIRADAKISVNINGLSQTITSGGLWGIESDSDETDLESAEKDELADLRGQLKGLGFSSRAISTAFKTIEHKDGE
jgi:hypothetical protein